jgi:Ca2+-binding RTX toxin-like protein
MFDATPFMNGTELVLYGTIYDDVVEVEVGTDAGAIVVKSSSNEQGGYAFTNHRGVTKITFYGGIGKDQFFNKTGIPVELYGGRDTDYLNAGNSSKAIIYGEEGEDVLMGNDFDNVLDGGTGNDILYGFGGNDILFGGSNYDRIYGGRGRDIIFGGTGADMLHGDEGIDFLDGGVDDMYDTIYAKGDGSNDVLVQETGIETYGDRDKSDRVLTSNDDHEERFRRTGQLPVSIGVTSSGYTIADGISFNFSAKDHNVSLRSRRITPTEVDAGFANWIGAVLDNYGETGVSVAPEIEPVEGNYVEHTPVDRSEPLDADEATPVDVSVADPTYDAYYAELAVSPVKPLTKTFKPSLSGSMKRF